MGSLIAAIGLTEVLLGKEVTTSDGASLGGQVNLSFSDLIIMLG